MVPEERERSEGELLGEYKEAISCLNVLHYNVYESLRSFSVAFAGLRHGEIISPKCIEQADGFRALVRDYRDTHERCVSLRAALATWSSVIADLPYPLA